MTEEGLGEQPLARRAPRQGLSQARATLVLGVLATAAFASIFVRPWESWGSGVLRFRARSLFRGSARAVLLHLGYEEGYEFPFEYRGPRAWFEWGFETWEGGKISTPVEWRRLGLSPQGTVGALSFSLKRLEADADDRVAYEAVVSLESHGLGGGYWSILPTRSEWSFRGPPPGGGFSRYATPGRLVLGEDQELAIWRWVQRTSWTVLPRISAQPDDFEGTQWVLVLKIRMGREEEEPIRVLEEVPVDPEAPSESPSRPR